MVVVVRTPHVGFELCHNVGIKVPHTVPPRDADIEHKPEQRNDAAHDEKVPAAKSPRVTDLVSLNFRAHTRMEHHTTTAFRCNYVGPRLSDVLLLPYPRLF